MWVADFGDDKLFAYKMSDKSRDSGEDFDLHSDNSNPNAIWSNGTTMWVTDSGDDKVYAYKMSDKSRDSGKDFDTLDAAGNDDPRGLWSDGTTMWVTDNEDKEIYAYKMSDKSRDSGKDFDTLDAAGNDSPRGIWSDGTTMWVADSDDDKVYAYKMSDESRDSGKEFDLHSENTGPYGIWSYDRATMWVADRDEDKLYAYNLPAAAPTIVLVAVTSMPALDTDTYGAGETIEVSVTFSEAVTATADTDFELNVSGDRSAPLLRGSGTATLVFGYTVVSSDDDDNGIWIGNQDRTLVGDRRLMAQSGTIASVATGTAADLTHAELGQQSDHKVDGSRSIVSVAVSSTPMLETDTYGAGETIRFTVTFSAAVNIGGSPVFRFSLGNLGVGRQVDAAYESGAGSAALVFGYTVVSSDEDDDGIWIGHQGQTLVGTHQTGTITIVATSEAAGIEHAALGVQTGHKVDGSRTAGNNAPVFADASATREVVENSAVGTSVGAVVTATDADNDTLTYSLEGTDAASFEIDSGTGQIKTVTGVTYDHEATQNTYSVTVKAADGNGGSDTIAVTIAVTDVAEKSAKPDKPTLAKVTGSTTSLTATWTKPDLDGGPEITGYALEYRVGTGTWTNFAHSGTAVTTTLTGLTADTSYQARVRAKNGETDSDWSDASDAVKTNAEMTIPACTLNTGDLWCGVVTVGRGTDGFGYNDFPTPVVGALSDNDFDVGANSYTILAILVGSSTAVTPGALNVTLAPALSDADRAKLVLHVGGAEFKLSEATVSGGRSYRWADAGLDWSSESTVTLRLREADNNAPEFATELAAFTLPENSAADTVVGTVTATDVDDDTLTYSLEGTDAASFAIDSGTGEIKTKTGVTYNYEATQNSYEMTAKADDGNGGSDTIDVAVALLDDDTEKSDKPAKPELAAVAGSSTSLAASWRKPGLNGGPEITGYDLEYRRTGGSWTNFPHTGTTLTATVTGLTANTEYEVRVQAKNGEGDSDWSDASDAARTNAVDIPIPPGLVVTLHLSEEDGSVLENHGWVTVTATASLASPVPFTVTVSADPVAPATDDDFSLSMNRVLSFAANETGSTGTVRIGPIGDEDPEPDDVVRVSGAVSNPAIRDPDDVTLTIRNDDEDLPQEVAVDAPAAVEEDAGTAAVTVTLTTRRNIAPVIDVELYYHWRRETATRGEDYTLPPGQLFVSQVLFDTVPTSAYSPNAAGTAWVAQRSFNIGIVDDREAEGDETIVFRVATASDESPTQTIAIRDDDTPVLRNVRLVGGPGSDGVWSAGERVYVEARYSLPVVVVQPEDCWSYNDDGTCRPPGPFVVVAFRSDARPGYGEWLSAQPVPYVGGSGTATLRFAYRVGDDEDGALRVVVADNGMLLRGATIRPLGGGDAELSEYTNTRVRQVDVVRPGGGVWTAGDTVRVKVRFAGPVQYAPSDQPQNRDEVFVDERRGTPTIRLRLGEAPNPLLPRTARYESGSGTDTLTFEYEVRAGDGRVSVVEAVADSLAANGATIRNEDGYDAELHHVDVLWYSPLALRVRQATAREGEPLRFTLELARASQAPVTVDYETADGTATAGQDYTAKQGTVTFAPGRTRGTVEVPVLRDGKVEGVETMVLRLSNARSEGSEVPVEMKVSEAQGAIENVAPEVNTPATGVPTINGTAQVGETLTAGTSGIADRNGLENATFSYQWFADDAKIAGANSSTRTLTGVDQGKAIKVRVSFTDDAGYWETLTSAPTEPVVAEPVFGDGPPGAPRNLTVTAGDQEITLSWEPPADNGNAPATRYRIEWRVDGKDYKKGHWGPSGETTYTKTDLANGVKYVFRVKAESGTGNYGPYGPASEEVSATPTSGSAVDLGTPVLSEPENLHHGMVRLDWQDIEDAGWYVVQYYHVQSGEWLDLPAAGVDVAFHGSSAVVSNLHGLSWLRVRAMSCAGESEWSQIEQLFGPNESDWEGVPVPEVEEGDQIEPCPVVLGTPVLSEPETLHHGMVRLDWQDIEDAGWYVVQYYHVQSGEWLDLPAAGVDVAFHGSSAVVSNLHGLSWLRVRAMSCAGESEWSQIEQLFGPNESDWEGVPVPEVEEGDQIEPCPVVLGTPVLSEPETLHHGMVRLDWQDIEDAGWYVVQYYHVKGGEWLDLPAAGVDVAFHGSSAVVSNLHGLSWLRVRAMSCAGESEWSQIEQLFGPNESDWEGVPVPEVEEGDEIAPCSEDADTPGNSPATGAPTISGTVQVGETLTANTSGIIDADGLGNVQYEYQWLADDADISGATNATYTLAAADEGKAIKVEVTFTDDAGNDETLTSAATNAVSAAPTSNGPATGAPAVSGTARVGETLTADASGIADADGLTNATFSYQWLADDTAIAGATASAYTLTDSDEGKAVRVRVSFTDDAGNDETLTSEATDAVAAAEPSEPPDKPTGLSATATHGRVALTWDDPQDGSITGYVILRRVRVNDQGGEFSVLVADTGSAAATYTDNTVAASTTYTYRIKAINEAGVSERSRWVHVDTPTAPPPDTPPERDNSPATGAPTITGTVQVGETLAADTSGIADEDGLSNVQYEYQWLADDSGMSGATAGTYTLSNSDEGKAVRVRVSFTDDAGNDETLTSEATAAVAAAEPAEPPDKPTGLSATATHGQVMLTWDDPGDDSITGYVILRRVRVTIKGATSVYWWRTRAAPPPPTPTTPWLLRPPTPTGSRPSTSTGPASAPAGCISTRRRPRSR